ncbi:MAG: hypothetical protein JW753_03090 [Dehalococcoidia bacterium]|nr:hypothetical protein [Dehalococcoidia bacterium]
MSGYDVLLFVGATTLVAAIVTLFLFQSTAARFERRINRRSRTLEGPVPGHRSLSSIGLNTESAKVTPRPVRPTNHQPDTNTEPSFLDYVQELAPYAVLTPSGPSSNDEATLSSLHTIQARSAALHADAQQDQSVGPEPLLTGGPPPLRHPSKRAASELQQEQGPATSRAKSKMEKAGGADSIPPSSAPAAGAEPTIAPKTATSKRTKRASAQAERNATAQRGPEVTSPDALADSASLDLLDALQAGQSASSLSQDSGLPDILAGLNEPDAGIQGLTDDLSDIDGGGLPTPAPKTPQKSRR